MPLSYPLDFSDGPEATPLTFDMHFNIGLKNSLIVAICMHGGTADGRVWETSLLFLRVELSLMSYHGLQYYSAHVPDVAEHDLSGSICTCALVCLQLGPDECEKGVVQSYRFLSFLPISFLPMQ